MAQRGDASPAVARAGFLLAGGLLAMGFAGLAPDRFGDCAAMDGVPTGFRPGARGAFCGEAGPHRLDREERAEILLFGERLDINRASPVALEALPAIGPRRAQAIVNEREKRHFGEVADLVRVRGIGRRTMEAIRPWVEVGSRADREVRP